MAGEPMGYLGEAHPDVAHNYEINARVYIAVLDLHPVYIHGMTRRTYAPLPKFPSVKRDLAIVVNEAALAGDAEAVIKDSGGPALEAVALFDVYRGDQLREGFKSLAYSLTFRSPDRTLTEDEVNVAMKNILDALKNKMDAELR